MEKYIKLYICFKNYDWYWELLEINYMNLMFLSKGGLSISINYKKKNKVKFYE